MQKTPAALESTFFHREKGEDRPDAGKAAKMLKIRFIVVDRTRSPFLKTGESFYLERLQRYTRMEWIETRSVQIRRGISEQEVLTEEGESILRRLRPQDYIVTLDRRGREYDSEGLAAWLRGLSTGIRDWTCFVIGGPLGLSKEVLDRSDTSLSLSRLTFTHEMSRLFLLERLYRAFTILEGHNYHR